ncbi:MAG: Ribosomal RNA small subunit methyltransferase A [Syntrophus sp. PtaB.Bin001]|nr:MAG: Ribosomal RNA small subunit methyltransferase A [Syntrophus sp. PtaB.Bin001]
MKSVRQIIRENSIKPIKRLGQCFLVDFSVMKKIIEIADIKRNETVLEIGSGLGLMTELAAEKAAYVYAVEIDKKLTSLLNENLSNYGNVVVVQENILNYKLSLAAHESSKEKIKVIGNIPYNISSPILFHILESKENVSAAVIMMQKEVADRLCAVPGTKAYGIPSVLFGLYTSISREITVSPSSFYPEPEVMSAVVKILINNKPLFPVKDETLFSRIVRTSFAQRRKTLLNNLKCADWHGYDLKKIQNLLGDLGISEKRRAEELSIQDFAKISNAFKIQ